MFYLLKVNSTDVKSINIYECANVQLKNGDCLILPYHFYKRVYLAYKNHFEQPQEIKLLGSATLRHTYYEVRTVKQQVDGPHRWEIIESKDIILPSTPSISDFASDKSMANLAAVQKVRRKRVRRRSARS